MNNELVKRKELAFQLYEVLNTESLCGRTRFTEHNRETFDAVMDIANKIATEKFATHNAKGDANEPTFDGQKVHMIAEVKEAFDAYVERVRAWVRACARGFLCVHVNISMKFHEIS